MKLTIQHQDSYSRGQLLLRTFFGFLYILIPHAILLFFVSIWACILMFIAWWVVLFTAKYPKGMFDFMVKFYNWQTRLNASFMNLTDGYPAIGINGKSDRVSLEVEYPGRLSRGLLLLRTFFGFIYVGIPHGIMLIFRVIATYVVMFLAWWVVLFTGKYPAQWHNFVVGTLRWGMRIGLYMNYMTDLYPPFSGKE
ncbi:MAG: DUF4389 domain-containing protein [Acidobacteria bacterium]|jgi:hypothetical protein|nr:DUF4389 domain-containing protein [Acidobacteriota bacterium]